MQTGDFVRVWFDTGAGKMGGARLVYGRVVGAGPKVARVMWESGLTNRIRHDQPNGVEVCNVSELDARALRRLDDTYDGRVCGHCDTPIWKEAGTSCSLHGVRCLVCSKCNSRMTASAPVEVEDE